MGVVLKLPIVNAGHCLVSPDRVGLVTDTTAALLLMEQPEAKRWHSCSCHAADLREGNESHILITDCDGEVYDFLVRTSVLESLLRQELAHKVQDDLRCSRCQGTILKLTDKGNRRAAMFRNLGLFGK
jgi:hypothetical protein